MSDPQQFKPGISTETAHNTLNVSEIFASLQGEGQFAGVYSGFIRLAGCDLRCRWCDTDYAWDVRDSKTMAVDDIITEIESFDGDHVVVTGGEPLIAPHLDKLLDQLSRHGYHVTLETAACRYRQLKCDLVSISPKLANSTPTEGPLAAHADHHESNRLNLEALQNYIYYHNYQLKFVVRYESDLKDALQLLDQLRGVDRNRIYLMPQAKTRKEYQTYAPAVAKMALEKHFRFSPRLHVELWDNARGK